MLLRFLTTISLLFPLVGVFLMERGQMSISLPYENWYRIGHPNGATLAFLLYVGVVYLTVKIATKRRLFSHIGQGPELSIRAPLRVNNRTVPMMIIMLLIMMFSVGGISNYEGTTNAGTFRAALGPIAGLVGGIIIKYIAPSMFAFALMTNVTWNRSRIVSPTVLFLIVITMLIGGSTGFKSSFLVAILPGAILYYWHSKSSTLLPLAIVAICMILFGYFLFTPISDLGVAFHKMFGRLFVAEGDVPWFVWDNYVNDEQLPSYFNTLGPLAGGRIFSFVTGITSANQGPWIMSHFSLMVTHFSGYPIETIMAGHNNTSTVFSEGVFAGGIIGVVIYAILAGLVVNLVYCFIDNRIRAKDHAAAAVGASYFVYAVMAWLIDGGLETLINISVPVLLFGTYTVLDRIRSAKFLVRPELGLATFGVVILVAATSAII